MRLTKYLLLLPVFIFAVGLTGCYSTPESGEIGVVRNGGPFDNKQIRQVVDNGSGNTWIGWNSESHYYPVDSQQRFFKMQKCFGNNDDNCTADAPPINVQTSDGVDVSIEGTFYLNTTFNGTPKGISSLKSFDTQFSTRTFSGEHAYDGTSGWAKFLAAIVEPVVSNNLREQVAALTCADLVSSCSLVQNQTQNDKKKISADELVKKNNLSNVQRVQQAVETGLDTDLVATLGGTNKVRYFQNVKFSLTHVGLPGKIQIAINEAQAQFAEVSKVNAQVGKARAQKDVAHENYLANVEKQKGYNACHSCARQDELSKLPSNLQTLVFGSNSPVAIGNR